MAVHDRLAVVIAFTLTSLSTVVVALRFYSRHFHVGKLGSSDWMMLLALLATWCCSVVNYYQVHFLDYRHAFDSKEAYKKIVVGSLLTWWLYRINYIIDHFLIKISILLFYNYIASSHKHFHRIVRVMTFVILASSFGQLVAAIFSCNPPADAWAFKVFWDSFNGIPSKQCYNPTILWIFNGSFNLLSDCIIWILPIPFVLKMQTMPAKARIEIVGIFSIGIVAIVASAVRLGVLVEWSSGFIQQGLNTSNLLLWGQVEQHAGIICASMPFLRPLARKLFNTGNQHREQALQSPSPGAKLIGPLLTPDGNPIPPRTPIIPSPAPTFGSNSPFRPPEDSLPPIAPVKSEIHTGSTD